MRARFYVALLPISLLAACAGGGRVDAPPPLPTPPFVPPLPRAMPLPPPGAAPNQAIPPRLADGSYATPNRNLTAAGTLWHLRAGLNVAVLTCTQSTTLAASYNRLLALHRTPLARAYSTLTAEQGVNALDVGMTRVYNYFAQPAPQPGFCPVAETLAAAALTVQATELPGFAQSALAQLDAPFTEFYRAYDAYRSELALWQAETAPHIPYDNAAVHSGDAVSTGVRATPPATR